MAQRIRRADWIGFWVDEVWFKKFEVIQQQGLNHSVSDHISILLSYGSVEWVQDCLSFLMRGFITMSV